jgi:tRNA-(MS[2]IO[6]A)-hydroxylase (MiaE)-like
VASWFSRRRPLTEIPRLKPRNERVSTTRVDLHELAPELLPYLGQAAYLQLDAFQTLSRVVAAMPDLAGKEQVTASAGIALGKYQGFVAEIQRRGENAALVMQPYTAAVDTFRAVAEGADWRETLLGTYVTTGLLDDFFIRLAEGVPGDFGPRAAQLLGQDAGQDAVVAILRAEISEDPQLASRLAMWGRRLVGDTLLVARSVLHRPESGLSISDEQQIEPIFTELIAAHTRRMDALGLTA